MKEVAKSAVSKSRDLIIENVLCSNEGYHLRYPLKEIKRCQYRASLFRKGLYIAVSLKIKADLLVEDTSDGVVFPHSVNISEEVDVLDEEDGVGEGYIMPGHSIDLDLLALEVIQSSLPLRLVRKKSVSGL